MPGSPQGAKPKIIGDIFDIETIAVGSKIRDLPRLIRQYGGRRWRKLKGKAYVEKRGQIVLAEVHWYECHGIGRREEKTSLYLEE
jgi:hypothetical protein